MKKKNPLILISDQVSKTSIGGNTVNMQNNDMNNNDNISVCNKSDLEKAKKRTREYKMTEEDKELNRQILKNMNRRQNFVKNPRFRNTSKCMLYCNTLFTDILNFENPFVVEPIIVTFRDYQINSVYQIDLKLTNRMQILTSFKYIPPVTENFSIKKIVYPKKNTGLIAPGMYARIKILFNATSLDNFEDEISIITETFAFRVPLRAIRESPALSLDNPMMCGKCLLGDQTSMIFRCKNNGGDAHFKFSFKEDFLLQQNISQNITNHQLSLNINNLLKQQDNQNFISINMNNNMNNINISNNHLLYSFNDINFLGSNSHLIDQKAEPISAIGNFHSNSNSNNQQDNEVLIVGPFSIFPQEFYLYKGMSIEIYVNFNPQTEGILEKDLIICCDSKVNLNHKIIGEGISIDFKILSLDGVPVDESVEKLENIFFEETYPATITKRTLKIKNSSSVPLKYHWSIYDMYENNSFKIEDEEEYFSINPVEGIFEAYEEINFTVFFQPKNSKNYDHKLDLIIEDVPFQAVKNYNHKVHMNYINNKNNSKDRGNSGSTAIKKNTFTKGEPFMLALNSPYPSYPIFSFNLRGKGKQNTIDVDSNIIDFGLVYIGEKINRNFSLHNSKSGVIKFRVSKILQSLKAKIQVADTDPALKVNNFFKWTDPGATVTDHFRTNCLFKLKKPMNENIDKIFQRVNKEVNNLNNLDLISEFDAPSSNNVNIKLSSNYSKKNSRIGLNNNNNINYLNVTKLTNIMQEEVDYLKFYASNEFLFKKEYEIRKFSDRKGLNKGKNSSKYNSKKTLYNAQSPNNNNLNNIKNSNSEDKNIWLNKKCKIINRERSSDYNNNTIKYKQTKHIERFNINSAVSDSKEKNVKNHKSERDKNLINSLHNTNNYNYNNHNNLKNLNLQNSLIVEESSFNNEVKTLTRDNIAKSPTSSIATCRNRLITNSTDKIKKNITFKNISNETNTESELEENMDLIMKKDEKININLSFLPYKLGMFKSSIVIKPDDGIPFSIDFKATIIGPKIIVDTACIDFCLFSVNEIRIKKIKIKNISKTSARYLIKQARFKNINFDNYIDSDYVAENEGIINYTKLRKKIQTLTEFENNHLRELDINIIDNYDMKFSPIYGTIEPNQEKEILVKIIYYLINN